MNSPVKAASTADNTDSIDESTAMIYGEVVTVKPIPTRQVTQIVVEIPDEHHIAATQLLFGRNAFIMPCASKTQLQGMRFGVTTLGAMLNPPADPEPTPAQRTPDGTSGADIINVTQWLALRGKDENFHAFLGVDSEAAAADKVREICQVSSRAEIAADDDAYKIFLEQIYKPFNEKFPTVRRFAFKDNVWNKTPSR